MHGRQNIKKYKKIAKYKKKRKTKFHTRTTQKAKL